MDTTRINIIENIVGSLNIEFKDLFDKGEIDRLFSRIYEVADEKALGEAARYEKIKRLELRREFFVNDPRGPAPDPLKLAKQAEKYRITRLTFYLKLMGHWVELYAQSKTESTS
jgi:hypothetical protein